MLLKSNIRDVLTMVDKKANCEEVLMDIGSLRNNHFKHVKDTQMSWEE